ncbi:MAG: hypothetical protein IPG51_19150 [Chloroflexi bacterium]|nr:hypothetical protein [Chloroflexota bacterium]
MGATNTAHQYRREPKLPFQSQFLLAPLQPSRQIIGPLLCQRRIEGPGISASLPVPDGTAQVDSAAVANG